jgi:xanthine dehydrogenase molybdopterin-binding subunit B
MALLQLEGQLPQEYLETEEGQALKARLDRDAQMIAALERHGFAVEYDDDDS